MSNIPTTQNESANIQLLRAQRNVYARVKRLVTLQVSLTVVLPVAATLTVMAWPNLKSLTAAVSLCVVVIDTVFLDRIQKDIRKLGAKIQESFDCAVLDLPWNKFTVGDRPEPETIHEEAAAHGQTRDDELRNWYPGVVGEVPLYLARIICQRTNLVYDSKLRRHFSDGTLALVIGVVGLVFIGGVGLKLPMDVLVLTVFAPAIPVVVWAMREYYRQRDTADSSDRLRTQAHDLWDRAMEGGRAEAECTEQARLFQNAIFEQRSSAPVIFDWVYRILRPSLEPQMDAGAQEMVKAAKQRRL